VLLWDCFAVVCFLCPGSLSLEESFLLFPVVGGTAVDSVDAPGKPDSSSPLCKADEVLAVEEEFTVFLPESLPETRLLDEEDCFPPDEADVVDVFVVVVVPAVVPLFLLLASPSTILGLSTFLMGRNSLRIVSLLFLSCTTFVLLFGAAAVSGELSPSLLFRVWRFEEEES
jgi:hypothetical protein